MSFPPYSIPKSSATTSTTNTNTTSESSNRAAFDSEAAKPEPAPDSSVNTQLLRGILATESPGLQSNSPGVSDAAPAVVTVEENEHFKSAEAGTKDLVSLFDKFDVGKDTEKDRGKEKNAPTTEELGPAWKEPSDIENPVEVETVDYHGKSTIASDDESTKEHDEEKNDSTEKNLTTESDSPLTSSPLMIQKALAMSIQAYDPFINSKTPDQASNTQKDLLDITGTIEQSLQEIEPPGDSRNDANTEDSNTQTHRQVESPNHASAKRVGLNEQYRQSHKPFDFDQFLQHLRKKSADPIVRFVRSFLLNFNRQAPNISNQQKIKIIADFKAFMNDKFALYEPFASMESVDLENSREGLEKLIMNRLYNLTFAPSMAENIGSRAAESIYDELREDRQFTAQLEKFSWVNGQHLDIDLESLSRLRAQVTEDDSNFLDYATQELNKINNYRAPRDKIICILNSCKIIFSFLRANQQETSADSFIPLLILVIIKAKTDHIISNIRYITNYRGEEWLSYGETSYYLSSVQGAIGFIADLNFNQLKIGREEYDAHMEAWDAEVARKTKEQAIQAKTIPPPATDLQQPMPHHAGEHGHPVPNQSFSPSLVLFTSAELVSKSITNFLSPSPTDEPHPASHTSGAQVPTQTASRRSIDPETMKSVFNNLKEIFPNIDSAVLQDLIVIKEGNQEECVEACLQLVNEV